MIHEYRVDINELIEFDLCHVQIDQMEYIWYYRLFRHISIVIESLKVDKFIIVNCRLLLKVFHLDSYYVIITIE